MSLAAVRKWLQSTLSLPEAVSDIYEQFQDAEAHRSDLTALLGYKITRDLRGRVLRWTGSELLTIVLTRRQHDGLKIPAKGANVTLDSPPLVARRPPVQKLSLTELSFFNGSLLSGNVPITGHVTCLADSPGDSPLTPTALEMRYYHPTCQGTRMSFCHLGERSWPSRSEIPFEFPPLSTDEVLPGPMVVFQHLVTAEDWYTIRGIQRISNVVGQVVGIEAE